MATTPSFDFVTFYVSDLATSLAYFTDVLGFRHVPEEDGPGFHFLTGDGGINLGLALVSEQTPPAGTATLYVKVASVKDLRAAMIGKGVEATPIVQRPFGSIFTVHTPDGYPLTMLETPAVG